MKISEIIKGLQKTKKKYGDVECFVFEPDGFARGELNKTECYSLISMNDDNMSVGVVFIDRETAEAFS